MSFVQVHDAGRNPQCVQRENTADPEKQFLTDSDSLIAPVQPRRQLPILGAGSIDVRVEEQQRASANGDPPDTRQETAGPRLDLDGYRDAVTSGRLDRQQMMVDVEVVLLLPAGDVDPLPEIPLVVIETDTNERYAEIGGALDVVPGEDSKTARIDGNRLVQPELRREVRHRARAKNAGVPAAPGVLRRQILLQPPVGLIDAAVERELRDAHFELIAGDPL